MEKEFVTYEIALKLKELGFDELCLGYFNEKKQFLLSHPSNDGKIIPDYYRNSRSEFWLSQIFSRKSKKINICTAPLYQQVIDWFREKHDFNIEILRLKEDREKYWGCITTKELYPEYLDFSDGNDYYTTKEKTILKAIEIIKNK